MTERLEKQSTGEACREESVGRESHSRKVQIKKESTMDPVEKHVPEEDRA